LLAIVDPNQLEAERLWRELETFNSGALVIGVGAAYRAFPAKLLTLSRSSLELQVGGLPAGRIAGTAANLSFSDSSRKSWISLSGIISSSSGGSDEVASATLVFEAHAGEYWSYPPSRLIAKWELLKAELTGTVPDIGGRGRVSLRAGAELSS
jgi:hypothetical protein